MDSEGIAGSESSLVAELVLKDVAAAPEVQGPLHAAVQREAEALALKLAAPTRLQPTPLMEQGRESVASTVDP